MLRVLLCDDEELFLDRVKSRVEAFLCSQEEKFEILAHTDTSLITDRELELCDLALLDVDLATPEDDGIALARRLRAFRRDTVLIFVTNYVEYAPAGYEVNAFRYILKKDLDAVLSQYLKEALAKLAAEKETFRLSVEGRYLDLRLDEILYFEIKHRTIQVYQNAGTDHGKQCFSFQGSLSALEIQLEQRGFLRVHSNYLVNMRHIYQFGCRGLQLSDGTLLRVSEKMYAENKKKYMNWMGQL